MKILFFTENNHSGGLDSILVSLINHWPHVDDELVLICNRSHPGLGVVGKRARRPVEIIAHEIPLLWQWKARVDATHLPGVIKKGLSVLMRYPFFWYWRRAAKKLFVQQGADRLMIVNGGYPAGDSCRAAAIAWADAAKDKPACIFNFHNLAVPARWWERRAEDLIDRLVARSSKAFVAVSSACADSMGARPAIASSGKVGYIYNGIAQPDAVSPGAAADVRREFGFTGETPMCLMLGTYEPRKGHAFLLEAFARVLEKQPSARLVICGYGYEDDILRVESLVRKRGLEYRVRLEGFRDDVAALIEAADVLLVSSQEFESFGLTIVEAMARSTPVVATDVGGIPEVVGRNEGGYCLAADDVKGYAERIVSLLGDAGLRKRTGDTGCLRYRKLFTAKRMAREYADIIRSDHHSDGVNSIE